jgi:hypothetical protein
MPRSDTSDRGSHTARDRPSAESSVPQGRTARARAARAPKAIEPARHKPVIVLSLMVLSSRVFADRSCLLREHNAPSRTLTWPSAAVWHSSTATRSATGGCVYPGAARSYRIMRLCFSEALPVPLQISRPTDRVRDAWIGRRVTRSEGADRQVCVRGRRRNPIDP